MSQPSPSPSASTQASDTNPSPVKTEKSAASEPSFGWNEYAEKLNGRFAMIGFLALLLLEFFTRQDFFSWMGF